MRRQYFPLHVLLFVGLRAFAADPVVGPLFTFTQSPVSGEVEMHIARASHKFPDLKPLLPDMAAHCSKKCNAADWSAVALQFNIDERELKGLILEKAANEVAPGLRLHDYGSRILLHLCAAFALSQKAPRVPQISSSSH